MTPTEKAIAQIEAHERECACDTSLSKSALTLAASDLTVLK